MSDVKFDFRELVHFRDQLTRLRDTQMDQFCRECARELAGQLLTKTVNRTPIGEYDTNGWVSFTTSRGDKVSFKAQSIVGKNGGTLRRGWTSKTHAEAEKGSGTGADPEEYAKSLPVNKVGQTYKVIVGNVCRYSGYVEFGHRTANHKGWVPGQFMLTISERELKSEAPKHIEQKLELMLKGVFKS